MSFLSKFRKDFEGLNVGQGPQASYNVSTTQMNPSGNPSHDGQRPYASGNDQGQPQSNQGSQYYYPGPPNNGYQAQFGYSSPPAPQGRQDEPQHTAFSPYNTMIAPASGPLVTAASGIDLQNTPVPHWIPYWSAQMQRWIFAETTGRVDSNAPIGLPGTPAFPGTGVIENYRSYTSPPQVGSAPPKEEAPGMHASRKPSTHTLLAAGGGFLAGAAATALVYEAVDAHKKKKRSGVSPDDFSDFAAYPGMEQNLECNICDQDIYGPYAHCKKCSFGDYDICRDCLAQGFMCKQKGKHRLIKVYPKYECDGCDTQIRGDFYHCATCNDGDWDVCQSCFDQGITCKGKNSHRLGHLYIPTPKRSSGKHTGSNSNSSSDSD